MGMMVDLVKACAWTCAYGFVFAVVLGAVLAMGAPQVVAPVGLLVGALSLIPVWWWAFARARDRRALRAGAGARA